MNLVASNATHLDSLHHLWNCCLGDKWPVSKDDLHLYVFTDRVGFHKENLAFIKEDRLVAYIAVHRAGEKAGIFLLLVDPEFRRQGLATRLFEEAVSRQRTAGARQVLVGSVGCGYFWPGVPDNCPETVDFLLSRGFPKPGRMYSLMQDIRHYNARCPVPDGVTIGPLEKSESDELLSMQSCNFPGWEDDYSRPLMQERYEDVIVARCDEHIVGAVNIRGLGQHHNWRFVLGEKMGELDNVGVAEEYRRRGIGLSLVDHTTVAMRQSGVETVLIGCTWLTKWYGQLGYEIWHEYAMWKRQSQSLGATPS